MNKYSKENKSQLKKDKRKPLVNQFENEYEQYGSSKDTKSNTETSKKIINKKLDSNAKFLKSLRKNTEGLIYISETDAEIFPFIGDLSDSVNKENLFKQIEVESDTYCEEYDFEDFFRHPSKIQDWFDERRIAKANQYDSLRKLLKKNLSDIKVFKIGKIYLDIYIVGLDSENRLIGIKTKAIET